MDEDLRGPPRWNVPDGARAGDGSLLHDDYLLADALVAVLDRQEWTLSTPTPMIPSRIDPLRELEKTF